MKHYTYKITNIKENKHYIGVRSAENPIKDLGIKYFSSSTDKEFMLEQQEFPERFEYKILEVFSTRKLAIAKEIELHDLYDVAVNESFYNMNKQTSSGFCRLGIPHSEETLGKMSLVHLGEKNHMYGKTHSKSALLKMSVAKVGKKNPMYGRTQSPTSKHAISIAQLGPKNHMYGKTHSEESSMKMKQSGKKRAIREAYRFIIQDTEGNLIHDEVIVNFVDFCKQNGYPSNTFCESYKTKTPAKWGRFKGWSVERITN